MNAQSQKENWFETVPVYPLIFFRSAVAVLSFFYFVPKIDNRVYLYLASSFHTPMAAWAPALPSHTGTALILALKVAAVLLGLGILPRLAAAFLASAGLFVFLLDARYYAHWYQFHLILLVFLALTKLPPVTELLRKKNPPPVRTAWPEYLVMYQIAVVFFHGGLEKILSPFWQFSGSFFLYEFDASKITTTGLLGVIQKASVPVFHALPGFMSVSVTAIELFITAAIFFRPWRKAGILTGFFFSLLLEIIVMPSLFAWDAMACFLLAVLAWNPEKSRVRALGALFLFTFFAILRFGKFVWH